MIEPTTSMDDSDQQYENVYTVELGSTVKGTYGWWSEEKIMLKLVCNTCGVTILETRCSTFFPLCCFSLSALILTVIGLLCTGLLFLSVFLLLHVYCLTMCVLLSYILQLPDCWLKVSTWKVLRPATSAQVFLGFPVSKSECWDGSQDSSCYCMLLM
jgi:hypothetical protein